MGLNVNFIFQQQFDNGKKQNGNIYYLVWLVYFSLLLHQHIFNFPVTALFSKQYVIGITIR